MADPSVDTIQLNDWLQRMRAGDQAAEDQLLRAVGGRLERLARKMTHRFPNVQRWAQTDDVLQNALLRLLRSLRSVQPATTREFFGLAAEQMRRELLDLARHYLGPRGIGANQVSQDRMDSAAGRAREPVDRGDDPEELERWGRFHEAVAHLPAEQREVVDMIFYHGCGQKEAAELLEVNVRTVRRRWEAALVKLHGVLKE